MGGTGSAIPSGHFYRLGCIPTLDQYDNWLGHVHYHIIVGHETV